MSLEANVEVEFAAKYKERPRDGKGERRIASQGRQRDQNCGQKIWKKNNLERLAKRLIKQLKILRSMQPYCKQKSLWTDLSKWVVPGILLLNLTISLSQPTFEWRDYQTNEKLMCQQCHPGTYMAEPCTKERSTVCKPCPENHYTEFWNYLGRCLYCNVFCNSMEEEAWPCNSTHNRECRCKPGYHVKWDFCERHSKCPLGSGVVELGNPQEDTKCTQCPQETFSYSASSTEPCHRHQNCSAQGLEVNVPGNQFHDTFCTSCKLGNDHFRDSNSGTEACQEAFIDFVPFEIKSARRLQRLKHLVSRCSNSDVNNRKRPDELQVDLHKCLIQLKKTEGREAVFDMLRAALKRMKLPHLQQKIQNRFPLAL